uniref:tRNA-dihydrouridine(16/17) synthase [NAD(P)(+)] n=1 Tax=Bionectria ochroleuca TaxID=29856 RepID=A0A0B7JQ23_BIOOC
MAATQENGAAKPTSTPSTASSKLHGREFYESIGKPKFIVAPMVDQSEFAWRMLTRSFIPASEQSSLLAYTPMFHARLFAQDDKYRAAHFQAVRPASESKEEPWLDGNPSIDRPLFVQFCANDPEYLLEAAKKVAPYCDAVDLNLGCPQGIARKGRYGAFLQEDQDLIFRLINTLHRELPIPVTAKIRILETEEKTLAYARNVLAAGASILTVHGRRREQKGHLTGTADWKMLRFLRDNLPPETVMFANGNILQGGDVDKCLEATGADGYERTGGKSYEDEVRELYEKEDGPEGESSVPTQKRCKRPWWVVQPIIRPLPSEAMAKGAIRPSKKDLKAGENGQQQNQKEEKEKESSQANGDGAKGETTPHPAVAEVQLTEQAKEIASRDELVSG